MILTWHRIFVLAVATLLLDWPSAQADYWYGRTGSGEFQVTTFPGHDLFGDVKSGQVRILFEAGWSGSSQAQPALVDTVAFNTDLTLSPNQIMVPQGWELTPNAVVPGKGRFSWALHTSNPQTFFVGVTIAGLGTKASPSHFWLPSKTEGISPPATPDNFAFHVSAIDYLKDRDMPWVRVPQGPDEAWYGVEGRPPDYAFVTPTPEPCTLALAGLGLVGLLAARRFTARQ
jgi:hypothetical protein